MAKGHAPQYNTRILPWEDDDALRYWKALREYADPVNPFTIPFVVQALSECLAYPVYLAVTLTDGAPVCGIPLFVQPRLGRERVLVPPFVPYTPLLIAPSPDQRSLTGESALGDLVRTVSSVYGNVALHLQPALDDIRTFSWNGWDVSPLYTYSVDLAHQEGPLGGWSKNNRRDYRNYKEHFVTGESVVSPVELAQLVTNSYGRHGRVLPVERKKLDRLITRLHSHGSLLLFGARDKVTNEPAAACGILRYNEHAAYWLAGSLPGHAMTVVMGVLFESLAQDGVVEIDMIGANTPSIAEFKRRFGSRLETYYRVERTTGILFRLAKAMRALR